MSPPRLCLGFGFSIWLCLAATAQVPRSELDVHHPASRSSSANGPVDMKSDHFFHSVLENDRVRVFKVEIPASQSSGIDQHRHDYIVVSLGKNDFEIAGGGMTFPMQMDNGEMQAERCTGSRTALIRCSGCWNSKFSAKCTPSSLFVGWADAVVLTADSATVTLEPTPKAHCLKPTRSSWPALNSVLKASSQSTAISAVMCCWRWQTFRYATKLAPIRNANFTSRLARQSGIRKRWSTA